ncbi:methylmalonyl-CoA mutase [Pseudonocardiaceae bacterium YIM PH 21723]|nr:methylmalonyl-CoA mutase [Pseudonocardiaceae bacterium YIM PH 21723]
MAASVEDLVLAGEFPQVSAERWQQLVEAVLRKSGAIREGQEIALADVPGKLSTATYDGITVQPLYTEADAPESFPGFAPYTRGGRATGGVLGGWDVRQLHGDPDVDVAKKEILADLENGASSLWLRLGIQGLPVADLAEALEDVLLDLAGITLDAGADTQAAAEEFLTIVDQRKVDRATIRGNLGADPIGYALRTGTEADFSTAIDLAKRCQADYPGLRAIVADALPVHNAGGSDAQELGASLAIGVGYLRALTEAGLPIEQAAGQLEFRYAATADQFLTIAKFRAARLLWARVTEACGIAEVNRAQRQHAVTSDAMTTQRDPWVNMLRTTLACFGAGVGGADAVTVQPFDSAIGLPDSFARRIARNTQALLVEESHVARVVDPAGGSWYVENLTQQLAEQAWAYFQRLEAAGGVLSETLKTDLADTWSKRSDNLAHRRDPLTGVSEFPNLTEKPVVRRHAPDQPDGGLPRVRYAQDYEKLRDRSDAQLAATGHRPRIFLATLGPVAVFTGRATFAANLFQAGGFETIPAGATSTVDEVIRSYVDNPTPVVCLCSTDKLYAERAVETIAALRAAGATRILLAGKPIEELKSKVDGSVAVGSNAIAVLNELYDVEGVA